MKKHCPYKRFINDLHTNTYYSQEQVTSWMYLHVVAVYNRVSRGCGALHRKYYTNMWPVTRYRVVMWPVTRYRVVVAHSGLVGFMVLNLGIPNLCNLTHTHTHTQNTGTGPPTTSSGGGTSTGLIIGVAAGGAIFVFVVVALLICLCCCFLRKGRSGDYRPDGPMMTARYWDPRSDHTQNIHGRTGSTISRGSKGSRGSIRSSISSIGSMIRLGRGSKRGSGRRGDKHLVEQTPMTVTPL